MNKNIYSRMIYTSHYGFGEGTTYTNILHSTIVDGQSFNDKYRRHLIIYAKGTDDPLLEVWEAKDSLAVHPYDYFSLVSSRGLPNELFFPEWTDLLHFMREYLPTLQDIYLQTKEEP